MTLTREEIQGLLPGRELDELIAEQVMGWVSFRIGHLIPNYSTDISAAWEVVENIMSMNLDVRIYCVSMKINNLFDCVIHEGDNNKVVVSMQPSLPEAICKAALLAVLNL